MRPSLDIEIREKLASYLAGEISLADFEDWFVPASWNVVPSGNQAAANLVYEIEIWLAEFSDGFWREEELKNSLQPLVSNYQIDFAQNLWKSGVVNSNVKELQFPFVSFDIKYEVESA
jgi:hypothetical protein